MTFNYQDIVYQIKKSPRAKHIRLAVRTDGRVMVTLPRFVNLAAAERIIKSKVEWIKSKVDFYKQHASGPRLTTADYKQNKKAAAKLVAERVAYFNNYYKFNFKKISIRNQSTRWGSCSRRGTLSFNYKLIFLPAILSDYIIVHELCHLQEMNHGPHFWALVAKTLPQHKLLRRELKAAGLRLL